jgi:hypothetical protein
VKPSAVGRPPGAPPWADTRPALRASGRVRVLSALGAIAALGLAGCGGGAPLLHGAHVIHPGDVRVGAGLSGQLTLRKLSPGADPGGQNIGKLGDLATAPGVAPWVGGRFGIAGDNEAGLTYTGRSVRIDVRHAFPIGQAAALSVGLGGSAVAAQRPGEGVDGSSVFGGGFDVPVLFGARSASDLYALWIGPRAGMEFLGGRVALASPGLMDAAPVLSDVSARHFFAGFVAGIKVGFRHVHVALELDGAWHHASGSFQDVSTSLSQLTLTPAGALLISF